MRGIYKGGHEITGGSGNQLTRCQVSFQKVSEGIDIGAESYISC